MTLPKTFLTAICALFLLIPAVGCAQTNGLLRDEVTIQTAKGEEYTFNVEMALSPDQQAKGLMNRTVLAEDAGMLFVFGTEHEQAFWMKDTLIPLDMIFIGQDGEIRHIHHMAKPLDKTRITSERPAMAVLEVNGGIADHLGISEGDTVIHAVFRNTNKLAQ